MSCAEQGVHHNVCLCVCARPLLSSHGLWLSVMSERVTLGQIRDPVANKAFHIVPNGPKILNMAL